MMAHAKIGLTAKEKATVSPEEVKGPRAWQDLCRKPPRGTKLGYRAATDNTGGVPSNALSGNGWARPGATSSYWHVACDAHEWGAINVPDFSASSAKPV